LALNKRKVLDAARKFAHKGAKEKALKEYARLLKADSRDAKLLLEIGGVHRRWGQNEEAISYYLRVAEQYKQAGFDARSVAVFKQILNLDNKRYPAYVSLAELYQRMGLDAEAVGALQTAADGYHSDGQKTQSLELLRKMATLDPSNTTSRMKVAELLRQEELLDDAVSEYEAIVEEMVRQGANDALVTAYKRILEIRPERGDIEFALARKLVQLGQSDHAETYARTTFDRQPEGDGHFDLLVEIYTELGKPDDLTTITKLMAKNCRDRGEEDQARELMQRMPDENAFELSDSGLDPSATTGSDAQDDNALEEDGFLDDDFLVVDNEGDDGDDAFIELDGDGDGDGDGDDDNDSSSGSTSPPAGDPDQLFAEASVYLRYGKRDQAIASLEALLAQEPNHRGAIEKIGEFHADGGDTPKAVEYWVKAATLAANAGDDTAVENLRERIAVLDPDAAQELVPDTAPPPTDVTVADPIDAEDEVDIDVFPESELDASGTVSPDLDSEGGDAADLEPGMGMETDSHDDSSSPTPDSEEEDKLNESLDGVVLGSSATGGTARESATAGTSAQSSMTASSSLQIAEDLEEAEFYMDQKLYDEAEAIFNRVLENAPNHPSAMLRLGELRAARGEDPGGSSANALSQNDVTLDPTDLPFEDTGDESAVVPDADANDDDYSANLGENSQLEIAVDVDSEEEHSVEIVVDIDEEEVEVEVEEEEDEAEVEEEEEVEAIVEEEEEVEEEIEDAPEVEQEDEDDSFDLAAELRETIEEEDSRQEETASAGGNATSPPDEGLASIFKDFKSGVEKTLAVDDYETRFDLGIAYRGMELFDDAMGEFQICLASPGHQVESLHMMGLCAMDLERFSNASNHLEQALAGNDLTPQKEAGLRFDLARSYEGQGDYSRAMEALEVARAADPSIPGIDDYVAKLTEHVSSSSGPVELRKVESNTDEFENFDDLVAEVEADDAAEETFESFDDVIAEAEASQVVAELADAKEKIKPDPEKPEKGKGKKRKKKRISFV
jgi:tetratricopeptide (TPR) repeat protein